MTSHLPQRGGILTVGGGIFSIRLEQGRNQGGAKGAEAPCP